MSKIPYFNESDKFVHIGSVTIPPGETRDVDARLIQVNVEGEAERDPENDPLAVLVALPVNKLVQGLAALSEDELSRLEALEKEKEKPRQGALAEITQERLRRAEQQTPGGLPEVSGDAGAANTALGAAG